MCCEHTTHHERQHFHYPCPSFFCGQSHHCRPVFWSKKKKIKMFEQMLEELREEAKDLDDYIAELKKEK